MSKTLWDDPSFSQYDARLVSWGVAYESAQDMMAVPGTLSMDIAEYRPPVVSDICTEDLTEEVWDAMSDILRDWDDMSCDDGWPILPAATPTRPKHFYELRNVIDNILKAHLDLSEAAWQPTGRVRRVTHDGTWEEIAAPEALGG